MSVEGGAGFDKLVILGTEFADDIAITDKGIFGAGLNVRYTTVEVVEVDGVDLSEPETMRVELAEIASARTVDVVVPSPTRSEVLLATWLTILAPMFLKGWGRSISLLTETPSLVTVEWA